MIKPLHAVLIHGLNNTPEMMDAIAARLEKLNISTTRAKLTGHWEASGRLNHFRRGTPDIWLKDLEDVCAEAQRLNPDKDLILVGYSIGALLGVLLSQSGRVRFQKMLLFSPSLFLRTWSYFPKLIAPLNWDIPSITPKAIRANPVTPASVYLALYASVKRFDPVKPLGQTLIVINESDELVSFRKIRQWNGAEILGLRTAFGIKHLVTDQIYVGSENWEIIWSRIQNFTATPTTAKSESKSPAHF